MTAARHAARTWTPTGSCASRRPGWVQSHPGTPAQEPWRMGSGQMVEVEVEVQTGCSLDFKLVSHQLELSLFNLQSFS